MQAEMRHRQSTVDPSSPFLVTAKQLLAIHKAQSGLCLLTGKTLRLPQGAELMKAHTTLPKWRKRLDATDRAYSITLVKVVNAGAWVVGNVMLIINGLAQLYAAYGSFKRFKDGLSDVYTRQELPVVTEEDIKHAKKDSPEQLCAVEGDMEQVDGSTT